MISMVPFKIIGKLPISNNAKPNALYYIELYESCINFRYLNV